VTRTAQKISGGTLEERVPVKTRGDEIDQLAITFNQMLDRIQTLLTEIKEMSDNMAHDLRSPITRIRGSQKSPSRQESLWVSMRPWQASTIEECDRLLDMINTMLMISKAEAGVDHLTREEIDLAEVVQEACRLFEPTAEDKGISLSCHLPKESHFLGDTQMIQRMLSNLLDNAIKYTPPGGSVSVSVSENDGQVVVSVKDTGIGISPRDLPHVFERFYRGDESRSQTASGWD